MSSASEVAQSAIAAPPSSTAGLQRTNSSRGGEMGRRGGCGGRRPGPACTNFRSTTNDMNGQVFECYEEKSDRRQLLEFFEITCLTVHNYKFDYNLFIAMPPLVWW